jgi:hypothetical protein
MERGSWGDGRPHEIGIDSTPVARPGVPREQPPQGPGVTRTPVRPEQQRPLDVLSGTGLREATPVFGTAQPAHGLSGAIRRVAYGIPAHRSSRWLLLVAGDRIEVAGARLRRSWWLVPALAALALGYLAVSRALEER